MPQQIDVPGLGIVEFPDGMSDEDMAAAIKKNTQAPYHGSILPISIDAGGHLSFDSNAGVLGMLKRAAGVAQSAVTLPGDIYSGKTPITGPDGHTNPEVINRSAELATLASPVPAATQAGEKLIPGVAKGLIKPKIKPPTTEQLAQAGKAGIEAAKNSGLELTGNAVSSLSTQIQQGLFNKGIHPVQAPQTYAILKDIENAPAGGIVTGSNIQALRESLGHTAQNFNPNAAKDQLAATLAIRQLDDFLPNVPAEGVLAGTPATTANLFKQGRGNYAAAQRSNDITGNLDRATTGILETADLRAAAANSGRNGDNAIRQRIVSILTKPKEVSGLSNAELEALTKAAKGGPVRNTARYVGNLLGGGGGLGQALTGGMGAAGGVIAAGAPGAAVGAVAPAVVGAASKTLANVLARRSIKKVDELIRKRSPLYEQMLANKGLIPKNAGARQALIRALAASQLQQ